MFEYDSVRKIVNRLNLLAMNGEQSNTDSHSIETESKRVSRNIVCSNNPVPIARSQQVQAPNTT